jgi:tetratricopeptide (TPR) repeat protein
LITAYRSALDRALVGYPDDVELLLLRGEAEAATGSPMSSGPGAVAFYQRAIRAAPDQFAARHYLIHAYENAGREDLALAAGEAYVRMAPAVPHAHHMYAHGLRRTGRTNEALDAFRRAEELELAYLKAENISPEFEWHYHHNEALMAAAYRYVGQMRSARERLRRIFDISAPLIPEELAKRDWPALLLAAGSVDEALAAAERLVAHPVPLLRAAGHLAAARIQMSAGRVERGGVEADAALRELRSAGPDAGALAADLRVVQGEFFLRSGQPEKGRAMIREGVKELRADIGPDAWSQTLFEIETLGRAARDVGDWMLAAELAEAMRQHDPLYAGSAYALGRVAEHRGDNAAAARFYRETLQRWTAADADHMELVDARKRFAHF